MALDEDEDFGYVVLAMTEEDLKVFSWDNVPGDDSERFIEFLEKDLKINWARNAAIEKADENKTIKVTDGENLITLKLNKEENKVTQEIRGEKTYEYILKEENGKLNIYNNIMPFYSKSPNEWKPFPFYKNENNKIIPINELISKVMEQTIAIEYPIKKKYKVLLGPVTDNLENLTEDQLYDLREQSSVIYIIDCFSLGTQSIKAVAGTIGIKSACIIPLLSGEHHDQDKLQLKKHLKHIYKTFYERHESDLIKEVSNKDQFLIGLIEVIKKRLELKEYLDMWRNNPKQQPRLTL